MPTYIKRTKKLKSVKAEIWNATPESLKRIREILPRSMTITQVDQHDNIHLSNGSRLPIYNYLLVTYIVKEGNKTVARLTRMENKGFRKEYNLLTN